MVIERNNKTITIPDSEVTDLMDALECDKDTAIETWLEDHEIDVSEETAALVEKTKGFKVDRGIKGTKIGKDRKPVKRKVSNEKKDLFDVLYCAALKNFPDVEVVKENKMLGITINGIYFKVDVIQTRKPKESA